MSNKLLKRKNGTWIAIGWMVLLLIAFSWTEIAEANPKEPDPLGFTVQAIRPDTQVETNKSYFFIETKPGISQVLKLRIKGMKKEAVKVKAYVANGTTGMTGNLEYESGSEKLDISLKKPLTEISQLSDTEFTLENFEEKIIEVTVTPPEASYDGIKLGALVFELIEETQGDEKKAVTNNYRYRVGLITTQTGEEYEDAQNLELSSTKLGLILGRKQVSAMIHNSDPKLAEKLTVEATVTKKGSTTILKQQKVENARMAPNSTYNFLIDWGLDPVKPGNYVVNMTAKSDYQEWAWKKEFRVSADEARTLNDKSPFKLVLPKWVPYSVFAIVSAVIVVTVLLKKRSTKWQKRLKSRTKKRKIKKEAKRRRKRE